MRSNVPARFARSRRVGSDCSNVERGQSLIEFAMVFTVMFMILLWIFELGWLMYTYSSMADAANEGVRYAIVHSGGDPSGTQARVNTFAATSLHNISALSVSVSDPDGSYDPPNRVRVTVTYTYLPWLGSVFRFFSITPPTMHTYAEARMIAQ